MALSSFLFSGNQALERCAVEHSAHILRGAEGTHVGKIQAALVCLDDAYIDFGEWETQVYGPSTEAAVLAYKQARSIINYSYQTQADAIVGIMTIKRLDDELVLAEQAADSDESGSSRPLVCRCRSSLPLEFQAIARAEQAITAGSAQLLALRNIVGAAQFVAAGGAAAPVAPQVVTGPASIKEPHLTVNINGSNSAGEINGTTYMMVPLGGTGTIQMATEGHDCFLMVPDTLTPTFPFAMAPPRLVSSANGYNVFEVSGSINNVLQFVDFTVTGVRTGLNPLALRRKNDPSPSFDKARDVTVTVKRRLRRNINIIFPTDALRRRSTVTREDVEKAFVSISGFYKRWCNLDVRLGKIIEHTVDEDLTDEVDFNNQIAKDFAAEQTFAGRRSKLLKNEADVKDDVVNKALYIVWKFKKRNSGNLAFTAPDNRMIAENISSMAEWTLTLAHEIGHSFGVPGVPAHPDPPGFLMTQFVEGIKPVMSLQCIEICNPNSII